MPERRVTASARCMRYLSPSSMMRLTPEVFSPRPDPSKGMRVVPPTHMNGVPMMINRRLFLGGSASVAALAVLAACAKNDS